MWIQNPNNHTSIKSIDSNHMKKQYDEDLEDQIKIEIIGIDQIIILKEPSKNLMIQQVMKIFIDSDNIVSRSLDYGPDKFVKS